jgi:phage terminase small subunit
MTRKERRLEAVAYERNNPMSALKNKRWELYCQGIIEGKTSDKAYQDAGYKPNRGNATRLKAKESVVARIAELQAVILDKHAITVERILKEYERLAFADIRKIFTDDGKMLLPHEMPDDIAAAVAGIEYTAVTDSDGKVIGQTGKIRMANKHPALKDLSQMFGLVESEGGKTINNTQINIHVTPSEKVRTIAAAFAKVSNE